MLKPEVCTQLYFGLVWMERTCGRSPHGLVDKGMFWGMILFQVGQFEIGMNHGGKEA